MITQVHQAMPERAISQLCELLQVSRSWYYEKQTRPEGDEADVELRDTIERIILDFPGYGYRRVTHALKRALKFWLNLSWLRCKHAIYPSPDHTEK